jgi:hypothetical protein
MGPEFSSQYSWLSKLGLSHKGLFLTFNAAVKKENRV